MALLTYASGIEHPYRSRAGKHGSLSIGWFALLVVAGGFLAFFQDMVLGALFPVEVVLRVLLLVQILFILVFGRVRTQPLPGILTFSLVLLSISMVTTPVLCLIEGADVALTLRAFYFMFGIGIFLFFLTFVPLVIERVRLFAVFTIVCLLFAAVQVLFQDLYFSEALRIEFGLIYDSFTNGRLRAVSFFSSAPRFAEFLVFILSWLLFDMLSKGRFIMIKLVLSGLCLWLLINTYSRSGYILFVVAAAIIIIAKQRQIFGARDIWGLFSRVLVAVGFTLILITLVGFVDFDLLDVIDATSLQARIDHWALLEDRISRFSTLQYLFGSGDTAMFSRSEADYFVSDNLYLALLLYSGFFGMFAFLLLFLSTILVGRSEISRNPNSRILPVLALYVGLFVEGMFVDNHNTVFLSQLVIVAMVRANRMIDQ